MATEASVSWRCLLHDSSTLSPCSRSLSLISLTHLLPYSAPSMVAQAKLSQDLELGAETLQERLYGRVKIDACEEQLAANGYSLYPFDA